jgi:hypothetical protein
VWASQDDWSAFKKINGNVKSELGIQYELPDGDQKNKFIESIDPKSGLATIEMETYVKDKVKNKSTINLNGKQIKIDYVEEESGNIVVLPVYGENYYFHNLPKSKKILMEYRGNLYNLDVKKGELNKFLKDKVGNFDIDSVLIDDNFYLDLVWGVNPNANLDETKVAFSTSRNTINDKNSSGQLWVKDISSGDEIPVYDGGHHILGWDENNNIYFRSGDSLQKINYNTKTATTLFEISTAESLSFPYLIHQSERGSVSVTNLSTLETKPFMQETLNRVTKIETYPEGKWALIFNSITDGSSDTNIIVLNLETFEYKILIEPSGYFLTDGQWINKSEFLVNTVKQNTTTEETFVISLSELE